MTMTPGTIDGTGHRILVIDDDLAIRVLLQAVLRRLNFEVVLAEDGQAGLERLDGDSASFDLILLDLMMPRLNGYEFIERVRDRRSNAPPHIIVFTAAGKRGVEKIPPDTICNSILKPFDLDRFIEIVSQCVTNVHAR